MNNNKALNDDLLDEVTGGVIGGMTVGTLAILITVPLFFIIFEYLQEKIRPVMFEEADQQFLKERERSQRQKQEYMDNNERV